MMTQFFPWTQNNHRILLKVHINTYLLLSWSFDSIKNILDHATCTSDSDSDSGSSSSSSSISTENMGEIRKKKGSVEKQPSTVTVIEVIRKPNGHYEAPVSTESDSDSDEK